MPPSSRDVASHSAARDGGCSYLPWGKGFTQFPQSSFANAAQQAVMRHVTPANATELHDGVCGEVTDRLPGAATGRRAKWRAGDFQIGTESAGCRRTGCSYRGLVDRQDSER